MLLKWGDFMGKLKDDLLAEITCDLKASHVKFIDGSTK